MIPFSYALLAFIPIAAMLMLDRNSARGFSIAYILGMMFLPSTNNPVTDSMLGVVTMPIVPDLDKGNVVGIGVLLGTILFHPERFDRFRVTVLDFVLLVVIQGVFLASFTNGHGVYDGISQCLKFMLNFMLIVFLARIHIGTPAGVRMFLLCLTIGSIFYAPLAVWEFRFSPQIHTTVYGYFQHVFQQHMRGGFFRPILFFSHGLVLGRFFAFTAFLALFPMRKELEATFGPIGRFLFFAPLLGLLVSMSLSPYLVFMMLCAGWFVVQRYRWAYFVLPVLGFLWLAAFFVDIEIGFGNVHRFVGFSVERAQSLEYRLIALRECKDTVLARPIFGWGGWNSGHTGRAVDSIALIELLTYGFFGATAFFTWWFGALNICHRIMHRAVNTSFSGSARAVTLMCGIGLLVSIIDSALDTYTLILVSGMLGISNLLDMYPEFPGRLSRPDAIPPHSARVARPLPAARSH